MSIQNDNAAAARRSFAAVISHRVIHRHHDPPHCGEKGQGQLTVRSCGMPGWIGGGVIRFCPRLSRIAHLPTASSSNTDFAVRKESIATGTPQ